MNKVVDKRVQYHYVAWEASDLPRDFPFDDWTYQIGLYSEYWHAFSGDKWEERIQHGVDEFGDPERRFPLRINPVRVYAEKHAQILSGEYNPSATGICKAELTPTLDVGQLEVSEEEYKDAQQGEQWINRVWGKNNGLALQLEGALITQAMGGVYYRARWWPEHALGGSPISIEALMPDFVLPVWDTSNYFRLLEAYIVYRIHPRQAWLMFGQRVDGLAVYVEHWTENSYSIYLNGKPITMRFSNETVTYKNLKNPFGVVPIVYIPRNRTGEFYGKPAGQNDLVSLSEELNYRLSDLGTATRRSIEREAWVSNVRGQLQPLPMPNGKDAISLGFAGQGGEKPEVKFADPPQLTGETGKFDERLHQHMMRWGGLSNIAFGEDEGSQRSALTLAFRMWPSTAANRMTRGWWTCGISYFDRILLRIGEVKMPENKEFFARVQDKCEITQSWYPMIPRDREQLVNEVALLGGAGYYTIEHGLSRLGDVKDPRAEAEKVKEEYAWRQSLGPKTENDSGSDQPEPTAIVGDD